MLCFSVQKIQRTKFDVTKFDVGQKPKSPRSSEALSQSVSKMYTFTTVLPNDAWFYYAQMNSTKVTSDFPDCKIAVHLSMVKPCITGKLSLRAFQKCTVLPCSDEYNESSLAGSRCRGSARAIPAHWPLPAMSLTVPCIISYRPDTPLASNKNISPTSQGLDAFS